MPVRPALFALAAALSLTSLPGCATAIRTEIATEIETDALVELERNKWALAARSPAAFADLIAADFYAVEPGDSAQIPARRMNKDQVLARLPLPIAEFEITDVRVVRPNSGAAILSYRVRGVGGPFEAFATSHWARREGRWVTVFYQSTVVSR